MPAPGAGIDAVLLESSDGATTSFSHELYLVPSGKAPTGQPAISFYGATRNAQAYGVNLHWASPRHLDLQYLQAQSVRVGKGPYSVAGREVAVQLRPDTPDPSAPAGGMAFNLSRKHGAAPRTP